MTSTSDATLVRREHSVGAPFAMAFGFALAVSSAVGAVAPAFTFTPTSVREFAKVPPRDLSFPLDQTSSGIPTHANAEFSGASSSLAQRIGEVRALTMLTTEQVGRLFGVSRRSVHNWINGNVMAPQHEERAARILSIMLALPGSTPAERRAALLDSSHGTSLFHQLVVSREEDPRLQVAGVSARERIGL
ncbi:MAG: helix-turn-helix domain-containing protein [Actinobacteria bacterium]|nr:helix-turn-helix domain-containing protein [Actinomycetota bacterium]